ncbi:MAG: DUF5695 domain-containing protein [Bifidobacteriaceae bacterium]|jgi:hypothetical protein|nr:DUF5695 domain-containing protein [Bifidobacteriaceae bacterium]
MGRLITDSLEIHFDARRGTVASLRRARGGRLELAATSENTSYPSLRDGPFLGDVSWQVWHQGAWRAGGTQGAPAPELDEGPGRFTVHHAAVAPPAGGLRALELRQDWLAGPDGLRWRIELRNQGAEPLEVGEVSYPLMFNLDYAGLFAGAESNPGRSGGIWQRRWHEERLQQHLHISGHGSYALYQTPSGLGPVLFLGPAGDSAWETAFQIDPALADQWSCVFEGPTAVATLSRATRATRAWLGNRQRQSEWFNGHASTVLAPGEAHVDEFQFALLDNLAEVRDQVIANGQVFIDLSPSPAVPVGQAITMEVLGGRDVRGIVETGNVHLAPVDRPGVSTPSERRCWEIELTTPGEKVILVRYNSGRWTRAQLYATTAPNAGFAARSVFIVERQQFNNPADPFGRDGAFLPYDHDRQCVYLASDETWQVGGSDEYALPIAMVLAYKNALIPVRRQIAALEDFIARFLWGKLQDPVTYLIKRGLAWQAPRPSGTGWSKAQSAETTRFNNYVLAGALYHAMYLMASRFGLGERAPGDYLELAWRTLVAGYEVGITRLAGAPGGAFQFELLDELREADPVGYDRLSGCLARYSDHIAADPYPFGSELFIDQTAHAQVYAAALRRGDPDLIERTVRVTRAMRAGYQASWFRYGNDERGSVCCWYGTPQNSEVLLSAFDRTGNEDFLRLGWGGLASFLTTLLGNGGCRGWFTWWPDRIGFDPRSLDTDLGLYAYLRCARSYVVADGHGGRTGYGCRVGPAPGGGFAVEPWDGIGRGVVVSELGRFVVADAARIDRLTVAPSGHSATVRLRQASAEVEVDAVIRTFDTASPGWSLDLSGLAQVRSGRPALAEVRVPAAVLAATGTTTIELPLG